ncbi:NADP-dependent oxidoreductase [Dongia sedimenti]|uniref:NADP-dependent oxidoreductase n=1 Tax=Dongia sedimenti TaxID=3064282 RepID=A0ABU0YL78_9PROT|nr:NADP-dependent oxidoreductase [Rhodospirillaceae bacterium R-7]
MPEINRRIVLAARPRGLPKPTDFRLEEAPIPRPADGEVLLKVQYLSLDPYMRGRMSDAKSYAAGRAIGQEMNGGTVASVLESRHPDFKPGETVLSYSGWQTHAVAKADELRKLDPKEAPVTTALGVLGMPGFTAYVGLRNIGQPKPGETVVVAAATGPVGSAVGQIAKLQGARAVGIAGGAAKCDFARNELGFDAVLDHGAKDFPAQLAEACPQGIDVYFENVGGPVWDAVFPLLNPFARIPVCGLIAQYNVDGDAFPGPDRFPVVMRQVLSKRLLMRGFIQFDFAEQRPDFYREMAQWIRDGRLKYREDIVDGLENAPQAFIGLLQGKNFGKLIVRIAAA